MHTKCTINHTYVHICDAYLEVGWVELLGEHAEGFGIPSEVADVEDGLRVREVVLLEVVVETSPRAAEVRDTCSCVVCRVSMFYR